MGKFILKRLFQSIIVLFCMSIIAFGVINLAPGEPAAALYGGQMEKLTQQERNRINENLGLNKNIVVRYGLWFKDMMHFDMGKSYTSGRNVNDMIKEKLPNTLLLFFTSFTLTVTLSILLGIFAGLHPNSYIDKSITVFSITMNGIPNFIVAIALIFIFSVSFHLLPSAGSNTLFNGGRFLDKIRHLILPVLTVTLSHVGSFSRFIQEALKDEMQKYYVLVAKANRVPRRTILLGVLKNAVVPFVNYVGSHVPSFFSGFVIVETVFAYSGIGNMIVSEIPSKNYPVLMGGIFITGIVVAISMLLVDIIQILLNPKLGKEVSK